VLALGQGAPHIDLANDELYEARLAGVDFRWVGAFMTGIDLRGANMTGVRLGRKDSLVHSYLQCTNLSGAHLEGLDLEDADLRGADLSGASLLGADLTGANLQGANISGANFSRANFTHAALTGMYGTARGLPSGVLTDAAQPSSQASCLADVHYWDEPAAGPTLAATPSPKPSPAHTATLRNNASARPHASQGQSK
jgi:hypothetical protein